MMSNKIKCSPGEMADINVDFISLVRKGANKQKVQIYKEDDDEPETTEELPAEEVKGFMGVLKSFFLGEKMEKADAAVKPAKKPTSFANVIAVADITDNMWRVNDTLRSIMQNIIADEDITDKKTALSTAIDDYANYMKDKIGGVKISKEDEFFAEPIEKSGRKVSAKNEAAIRNALSALKDILADMGEETVPGEVTKQMQEGEDSMKKEDIAEVVKSAIDEALKPINDQISQLEKKESEPEVNDVTKEEQVEKNDVAQFTDIIQSAVSKAIEPISKRLETIEKSRSLSRTEEREEDDQINKASSEVFGGYFM